MHKHNKPLATPSLRTESGFSLIELMIVVAIIAIIAGVAMPSYRDYIVRSNRALATAELLEALGRQEQYFVNTKGYATNLTSLGYAANGYYIDSNSNESAAATGSIYKIALAAGASTTTFTLQAIPQGGQDSDDTKCKTLSITNAGVRGESGTGSVSDCW